MNTEINWTRSLYVTAELAKLRQEKETPATPESLRAAAKLLEEEAKKLDPDPQMKLAYDYADSICSYAIVLSRSKCTYSLIEYVGRGVKKYSPLDTEIGYKEIINVSYKQVTVEGYTGTVGYVTLLDEDGDLTAYVMAAK